MSKWIHIPVGTPLTEVKRSVAAATLVATKGNRAAAARLLGINPKTLYRWETREGGFSRGSHR